MDWAVERSSRKNGLCEYQLFSTSRVDGLGCGTVFEEERSL
jgi:hypothetical protein